METEGTVIWYRPEISRGVVRLDGGKQHFFSQVEGLDEIEPLQRVRILNAEKGADGAVITGFEDGRKEFGAPLRPMIRRAVTRGSSGPRNPDAPPDGTIVVHDTHGRGTVVRATAKMVRVRFDEDGRERTIRPSSIQLASSVAGTASSAAGTASS